MNKPSSTRYRIWIDNDFSGDPDDLFQLAHHLLCPSVEVRGITGSHLAPGDFLDPSPQSAQHAVEKASDLVKFLGSTAPVWQGAPGAWEPGVPARASEAAQALAAEARRDDPRPLFVACGAGLSDVATVLSLWPELANRMTVVWIGGPEYPGVEPPPGAQRVEYNLNIDIRAAQFVFGSAVPLWQVPRSTYRQCLVSLAELDHRIGRSPLGRYLITSLDRVFATMDTLGWSRGETYVLGDQPLVLLTALGSAFDPFPASSPSVIRERPSISDAGGYGPGTGTIRVFTQVDCRLLFEDMFAKVTTFSSPGTLR